MSEVPLYVIPRRACPGLAGLRPHIRRLQRGASLLGIGLQGQLAPISEVPLYI